MIFFSRHTHTLTRDTSNAFTYGYCQSHVHYNIPVRNQDRIRIIRIRNALGFRVIRL